MASGINNPVFVLSLPAVQALVLAAVDGPLSTDDFTTGLENTPVTLENLLALELFRADGERFRLNYLVLTVDDRQRIRAVANDLGQDLAQDFLTRRDEFDALFSAFGRADLRDELAFGMIAGFVLNWEGLNLTTELGLRAAPIERANGGRYIVHSSEIGAELPSRELYWGSHAYPGSSMAFATFGDGNSIPRVGIPDFVEAMPASLRQAYGDNPDALTAAEGFLVGYMIKGLEHLGLIMSALAIDPQSRQDLGERTGLADTELSIGLQLLIGLGYIHESEGKYAASVVVLSERDGEMLDHAIALGREIMQLWLDENYGAMQLALSDLTPSQNGLPFELVFSEVWHDVFGLATRDLARSDWMAWPYEEGRFHQGFVPIVWDQDIYSLAN